MSENVGLLNPVGRFKKGLEQKDVVQSNYDLSGVQIDLDKARKISEDVFGRVLPFTCTDGTFTSAVAIAYGYEKPPKIKFSKLIPTDVAIAFLQHFEANIGQGLWVAPPPQETTLVARFFTSLENKLAKLSISHQASLEVMDEFVQSGKLKGQFHQLEQDSNDNYVNPTFKRYFELLSTGLENIKAANLPEKEYEIARSRFIGKHLRRYMTLVESIIKGYYAGTLLHEVSHLNDAAEDQEQPKTEKRIKRVARAAVFIAGPTILTYLGMSVSLLIDKSLPESLKYSSSIKDVYGGLLAIAPLLGMGIGLKITFGINKAMDLKEKLSLYKTERNSNDRVVQNSQAMLGAITIPLSKQIGQI